MLDSELSIDLVFTDVVLPKGKSGVDLAAYLKEHRPGLPVLLTSGYSESALHPHKLAELGVELLRKPFTIALLDETLGALFGKQQPGR